MKDVSNGWEFTPKIRLSIHNPGHCDVVNRPESEFPLGRQVSRKLYLDSQEKRLIMDAGGPRKYSTKLDAHDGKVEFIWTAPKRTELTGYFSLKLWVELFDTDDMDLWACIDKVDKDSIAQEVVAVDVGYLQDDPQEARREALKMHRAGDKSVDIFFPATATGRLRLSHRELDVSSTPHEPVYTHREIQRLQRGQITSAVIELWPLGMIWEAGEKLRLTVATYNLAAEYLPHIEPVNYNAGSVALLTGEQYDSHLLVPLIP